MTDIISELQDLRHLQWAETRHFSGIAGSFLKACDDTGKVRKYYKLSDYDPVKGIVGHECVNEIIVQRLLDILKIDHLRYRLIHAVVAIEDHEYETWLCESEDLKKSGESKIALEDYYQIRRMEREDPFAFCQRMGWEDHVHKMIVIDYLILNRDRHGANIEILRSLNNRSVRPAPLFDHGVSLVCRCLTEKELAAFDVMEDRKVQAFIGSNSTRENLKLLPEGFLRTLPPLPDPDRANLFAGLEDALSQTYQDKIREMIWRRWQSLGDL